MLPQSWVCVVIERKRAQISDAVVIAQARQQVWQQTYRGIYSDTKLNCYDIASYAAADQVKLMDRRNHYYLFLDGDACVGYFSFGPYHYGSYKDFTLCLNHLYILDGYKGRGLGRIAFQTIIDHCKHNGIQKFFCGCNANNHPALSFYSHMGGVEGDMPNLSLPKEDQIIHFEFYLGE